MVFLVSLYNNASDALHVSDNGFNMVFFAAQFLHKLHRKIYNIKTAASCLMIPVGRPERSVD